MSTISKKKVQSAVDKLTPEMLEEAWLFLEFLSFKASKTDVSMVKIPDDPEGAFPELDIDFQDITAFLQKDEQERANRLLPQAK